MNLRDIVKQLRASGHKVGYKARKDGSIRITSIDGKKFSSKYSEGNKTARAMTGRTLSERKTRQLEKGRGQRQRNLGRRIRKPVPKMNPEVRRALRKAQRAIRKAGQSSGTVTARNVRYYIDQYGEEEAIKKLGKVTRYYQGIAYEENVRALSDRMAADGYKLGHDKLVALSRRVWENRETFLEKWIAPALETLYMLEISTNGLPAGEGISAADKAYTTLLSIFGW